MTDPLPDCSQGWCFPGDGDSGDPRGFESGYRTNPEPAGCVESGDSQSSVSHSPS